MKVEVDALSFRSLTVLVASVDVKQHLKKYHRAQELCENRGGRPELPVLNSPYGLCGREASFDEEVPQNIELCES